MLRSPASAASDPCECCVTPTSWVTASASGDSLDGGQKRQRLMVALVLVLTAAAAEAGMGMVSHSLALVAESGHMAADGVALALALIASWLARRSPENAALRPLGYRRPEVLAALINSVGLAALAGWIGWEAIAHLSEPPHDILSGPMLITALVGLGVNGLNATLLHPHSHHDLNVRGAFLHMLADVISAVGVVLAAIAIALWHWLWIDSLISVGVAVLIALSALPLIRQSVGLLFMAPSRPIETEALRGWLAQHDGVQRVEAVQVWAIAPSQTLLAAQLVVNDMDGVARDRLVQSLHDQLRQQWPIHEAFIQVVGRDHPQRGHQDGGRSSFTLSMPPDLSRLAVK